MMVIGVGVRPPLKGVALAPGVGVFNTLGRAGVGCSPTGSQGVGVGVACNCWVTSST